MVSNFRPPSYGGKGMRIHVLGPTGTDSERAARHWSQPLKTPVSIEFWPSYTELFRSFADVSGDHIVMPAGYVDRTEETSWVDLHFGAYARLALEEVFALPTMTMAILEQNRFTSESISLQPATEGLLHASEQFSGDCPRVYVPSKPIALTRMLEDKLHYCLTTLPKWSPDEWKTLGVAVKDTFNPTMVWCVYRVR